MNKDKIKINKILKFFSVFLIVIVLIITNLFFGNPISKTIVNINANKYIAENYKGLDLKTNKVIYNFKDGYYDINLQDKNSIDSNFTLSFDSFGRLKFDTYDDRISNTYRRFLYSLNDYAKKLEKENNLSYEISLYPTEESDLESKLSLDQKFVIENFPADVEVNSITYSKKTNLEEAIKILQNTQKIMDTTDLKVTKYSIIMIPQENKKKEGQAESWKNSLSIFDIPDYIIRDNKINELEKLYKIQSETVKK